MQGLSDGYFILPATVPDYLARTALPGVDPSHPAFREAEEDVRQRTHALLQVDGRRTVDSFRRALAKIPELRDEFHKDVRVLGTEEELNQSLEKAGRVADFLELAELMCTDALHRAESCGGHFRLESQTSEGEAQRDDAGFCYVAAWEY